MDRNGGGPAGGRAVSNVLSVLLMVAVAVGLAAVAGTALLEVANGLGGAPSAGADASFDATNDSVRVTYTATGGDEPELEVNLYNVSGDVQVGSARTLAAPGEGTTFDGLTDGETYEVRVVAAAGDDRTVVLEERATV